MNVHDFRRLRVCKGCSQPGDSAHMIPTDMEWWHGRCYVSEFGEDRFLTLPRSHVAGSTLDDIGVDLMKRWLDKVCSDPQAVPTCKNCGKPWPDYTTAKGQHGCSPAAKEVAK